MNNNLSSLENKSMTVSIFLQQQQKHAQKPSMTTEKKAQSLCHDIMKSGQTLTPNTGLMAATLREVGVCSASKVASPNLKRILAPSLSSKAAKRAGVFAASAYGSIVGGMARDDLLMQHQLSQMRPGIGCLPSTEALYKMGARSLLRTGGVQALATVGIVHFMVASKKP